MRWKTKVSQVGNQSFTSIEKCRLFTYIFSNDALLGESQEFHNDGPIKHCIYKCGPDPCMVKASDANGVSQNTSYSYQYLSSHLSRSSYTYSSSKSSQSRSNIASSSSSAKSQSWWDGTRSARTVTGLSRDSLSLDSPTNIESKGEQNDSASLFEQVENGSKVEQNLARSFVRDTAWRSKTRVICIGFLVSLTLM